MAEQGAQIEIEIVLDDGSIKKGFARIQDEAKKSGGFLSKSLSLGKTFGKLAAGAAAAGAAIAGVATVKGIQAAKTQEDAVNQLTSSLAKLGQSARLPEFEEFAAQMQRTTKFGDEAVLSQLAFAQSMGASGDQSKTVLKAAADMSAALNIDLNSAVRNISKTLGGYAGELGEVIPELKNLTAEQLKSGEGVTLLANKYRGFAQNEIKTFSGATAQMGNAFGDFLEGIGEFFIKSPTFIKIVNKISSLFSDLGDSLKKAKTRDFIAEAVNGFVWFSQQMVKFVFRPIEVLGNFVKISAGIISKAFDKIKNAIKPTLDAISSLLDRIFGGIKGFLDKAKSEIESGESPFKTMFDTTYSDQMGESIKNLGNELTILTMKRKEATESLDADIQAQAEKSEFTFAAISEAMTDAAKNTKITAKQMGQSLMTGLGGGVANAFASFGKALAKGENALDAFLNALISSMGQMAIQLGTQFILQGLAYMWAGMPNGGALVAAGGALAAFGGILSAVGGGGAGGSEPTGAAGTVDTGTVELSPLEADDVDELERGAAVNVNIEGSLIGTTGEDLGLEITNILNDAGFGSGTQLA